MTLETEGSLTKGYNGHTGTRTQSQTAVGFLLCRPCGSAHRLAMLQGGAQAHDVLSPPPPLGVNDSNPDEAHEGPCGLLPASNDDTSAMRRFAPIDSTESPRATISGSVVRERRERASSSGAADSALDTAEGGPRRVKRYRSFHPEPPEPPQSRAKVRPCLPFLSSLLTAQDAEISFA